MSSVPLQTSTTRTSSALEILSGLLGAWRFERAITGFESMGGTASFTPSDLKPAALLYREELKFPAPNGELLSGHREYLYVPAADSAISLFFVRDKVLGELFLTLPLNTERASASHQCKADLYEGTFAFDSPDCFSISYRITGPHKNHMHVTTYRR